MLKGCFWCKSSTDKMLLHCILQLSWCVKLLLITASCVVRNYMWLSVQKLAYSLHQKWIQVVCFSEGEFITLKVHDWDTGACGTHQLGVVGLKLFLWSQWCLLGLVVWFGPSCDNSWRCISCWGDFASFHHTPTPPHPHPPHPPLSPPTHHLHWP